MSANALVNFLPLLKGFRYFATPLPDQLIPFTQVILYISNVPLVDLNVLDSVFCDFGSYVCCQYVFDKQTLQFKNSGILYFGDEKEATFCVEKYYNLVIGGYSVRIKPGNFQYKTKQVQPQTFSLKKYNFEKVLKVSKAQVKEDVLVRSLIQFQQTAEIFDVGEHFGVKSDRLEELKAYL